MSAFPMLAFAEFLPRYPYRKQIVIPTMSVAKRRNPLLAGNVRAMCQEKQIPRAKSRRFGMTIPIKSSSNKTGGGHLCHLPALADKSVRST
jgi:hypothetical protein